MQVQFRRGVGSQRTGGAGRASRVAAVAPYSKGGNRMKSVGNRRIYVGNLAFDVDWKRLKDFFKQAGDVLYADVLYDPSGKSKGCGIVEFGSPEQAEKAIHAFNNVDLDGRPMFLREDREDKETNGYDSSTQSRVVTSYAGNRIYVGNLAWDVTWQQLKDTFASVAPVAHADVLTDATGRSKGCGIVEFQSAQGASAAIEQFNNMELNGRPMFVREDREAEHGVKMNVRSASASDPSNKVYVSNLSWDVNWTDLKDHFKKVGGSANSVIRADVITESTGRSKGCGVVEFASPELAQKAIQLLNNSVLRGRPVFVREDRDHRSDDNGNAPLAFATKSNYGRLDEDRALPSERAPKHGDHPQVGHRSLAGAAKVYVGNLDWGIGWQTLKDYFKQAGTVNHAEVVTDHTGKSRGFGIVEMASPEDAQNAISMLGNSTLSGRQIIVREDSKQQDG
jgi:RNA recognition motif-containing protein